jgi:hypothetical protein
MKFLDWLQSGKFIRNRDVVLNIFWLVITAFLIGLLIGSEYNGNGAGASSMKRRVAVESEVHWTILSGEAPQRNRKDTDTKYQTVPE